MNSGHANRAAIRLVLWSLAGLAGLFLAAWVGSVLGALVLSFHKIFIALWAAFLVAVLYLSRDPDPVEPSDLNAVVSPAHGRVETIEDTMEHGFMSGACKRISIVVAWTDVQVQYAPVAGTLTWCEYRPAAKMDGVAKPESLWIGLDVVGRPETKMAVGLVAGSWGRRILPWVRSGDVVARAERLGMMRPAQRVELILPARLKLLVNPGDEVTGGQSIVAKFE
jgi:phosphatidylserine decarboxylase